MDQLEAQGCGKVHLPNHRKVHLGTLRTSQKLPKIHTSKPLRPLDLFFCCPLPANQLGPGVGQSTDQRQAISRKRIRINCHCGSRLSRLFACNWFHWSQWFFLFVGPLIIPSLTTPFGGPHCYFTHFHCSIVFPYAELVNMD